MDGETVGSKFDYIGRGMRAEGLSGVQAGPRRLSQTFKGTSWDAELGGDMCERTYQFLSSWLGHDGCSPSEFLSEDPFPATISSQCQRSFES